MCGALTVGYATIGECGGARRSKGGRRGRGGSSMARMSQPSGARSPRPPSAASHLLGYMLVTHPLPSAMYVIATALLSLVAAAAAQHTLDISMLSRVLLAVAAAQVAVGSFNDYCDRALDAA